VIKLTTENEKNLYAERALSAGSVTYRQLRDHGVAILTAAKRPPQVIANFVAALNLWIRTLRLQLDATVGEEFGVSFNREFLRFSDENAVRLAVRTQKDRQEQVFYWQRIYAALLNADSLPLIFSEAVGEAIKRAGITTKQVAREIGVSDTTLYEWASGTHLPKRATEAVERLATVLGLPVDTFTKRLPPARRVRYLRNRDVPIHEMTDFGKRLSRNRQKFGRYAIKRTARLEAQWKVLLALKTDPLRPFANKRNTWRLKPIERTGFSVKWMMLFDGQVCATSSAEWGFLASYLGFLTLPKPDGIGIQVEAADTLAWLALPEYVEAYAKWMQRRAGMLHNGVMTFLQKALSNVRPQTGFLWCRPEIRSSLPPEVLADLGVTAEAWKDHCAKTHKRLTAFSKKVKDSATVRRSRDPNERAGIILQDKYPLKVLVRMIHTLENSPPPPAHLRDYRTWLRDVLLLKMLVSNPLRVSQISVITYRPDNTGNLRRTASGGWRLCFLASDFKNEKGAAKTDYVADVPDSIAPWIARYLTEARPYAVDADRNTYVFLPFRLTARKVDDVLRPEGLSGTGIWTGEGIADCVKRLTAIYIPETRGFGPQIFRHIIATDHLRRHPGDFLTVAKILHDELATVMKNYAHLTPDDGLRTLHREVDLAYELVAR